MIRIAKSYWQAELSRKAEGIISINLLYELYPWLRISINMVSVKEGYELPVSVQFVFETVSLILRPCQLRWRNATNIFDFLRLRRDNSTYKFQYIPFMKLRSH
jgi:hypothetical protein